MAVDNNVFNPAFGAPPGPIKAWVNFVGSSGAINSSLNVSSVTRNSAGDYTINFASALANVNYVVTGMLFPDAAAAANGTYFAGIKATTGVPTTKTTSAVRVLTGNLSVGPIDPPEVGFVIVGS